MLRIVGRRFLIMIPTLFMVSIMSFFIIQLPPGDYITYHVASLMERGETVDEAEIEAIKVRYSLGEPFYKQYLKWMWDLLHGDFGRSYAWNQPVSKLVFERLPASAAISLLSMVFVFMVGIPMGTFSATHQYSVGDYVVTIIGFIGLAIPNFFLALMMLYWYFTATGDVLLGFFSPEFLRLSWSFAKIWDLMKHLWIPVVVVGTSGTCGMIRVIRANLLDELQKQYVMVARSKGLSRHRVLYKYPFRIAINPMMSTIGWLLPSIVGGELLVSLVLNVPTLAPVFLKALQDQDMYLAGSIVIILSTLTVIGTLISDIALLWVDPRIREAV